jgi:hypothetical protein
MEPRPLGGSSPPSLSRSLHRKWGKDAAATLRSSRSLVACLSPSARALQANCDKLSRAQQQFATLRHQPATMPGKTCLWARPSFPRMTQPRNFPSCGVFFVHGSHQLARPRLLPFDFSEGHMFQEASASVDALLSRVAGCSTTRYCVPKSAP